MATLDIVKEIPMMNKVFNFKSYFVLELNLFLGVISHDREHFWIGTKVVNFKKQSGTGLHTEYPLSGKHMFEVLPSMDYWSGAIWFHTLHLLFIPVWYTNKITIIDFTIYTQLFLVKLKSIVDGPILHSKSIVDGPILHSKSVVDGSILHCKAKVCVFSKIWW